MRTILFILSICASLNTIAQDKITSWEVNLNTDSLLMGNRLKVTFTLKNAKGRNFEAPGFDGFSLVMGPSQSTSMSIINGDMTQEQSYTYELEPIEEGTYYIEPAAISINGEIVETAPTEVIVFPNPDGIIQNEREAPLRWNELPWEPPKGKLNEKKKKKIYKI